MNLNRKYKIKDSVDLFLTNDKYITVYFMNSRQRKTFRVNDATIYLLQNIDGVKTIDEICTIMYSDKRIKSEETIRIIESLELSRIITEISDEQTILPQEISNRFSRQINYFAEFLGSEEEGFLAQKKLMESHVLIFGCGAIGGNIAIQLAMAGVEHLALYDYDQVEDSDVSRHIFFRNASVGENKVLSVKKEILRINANAQVETYCEVMKPESNIEDLVISNDFVVNTLDEPYIGYTSAKISRICIKHKIPHYIGGGFDAHLASTGEIIIPHITPCVECYAGHFKTALKNWKPEKHPVKDRYFEIGGLASLSLFSSSYACIEIIKYLTGLVDLETNFKVRGEFLFHDMSLTYLDVERDPDCPVCGRNGNNEA